jgi:hypothetical protein
VSGSVVVVVVVVDCLLGQFVANLLSLTFSQGVHINIYFKYALYLHTNSYCAITYFSSDASCSGG